MSSAPLNITSQNAIAPSRALAGCTMLVEKASALTGIYQSDLHHLIRNGQLNAISIPDSGNTYIYVDSLKSLLGCSLHQPEDNIKPPQRDTLDNSGFPKESLQQTTAFSGKPSNTSMSATKVTANITPLPAEPEMSLNLYTAVDAATKRFEHFCKLEKNEKTKLLQSNAEVTAHLSLQHLLRATKTKLVPVDSADPSKGFRLDFRSSTLKKILQKAQLPLRVRLQNCHSSEVESEAREYLHNLLSGQTEYERLITNHDNLVHCLDNSLRDAKRKIKRGRSSEKQYKARLRELALWRYILEGVELKEITSETVECFIDTAFDNDVSSSTLNKYLISLREIVRHASIVGSGWIPHHVEVPSFQSGTRDLIEVSKSAMKTFIESYAQDETEKNFLWCAYYTGARKSNLTNNFLISNLKLIKQNGSFELKNASFVKIDADSCKGKRNIRILIQPDAREYVTAQLAYREKTGITSENLFALASSGKTIEISRKRWKAAAEEAGLGHRFTFHHLRHNRAHQILQNGGSFEDVRQLLALASIKMVEFYYGHTNLSTPSVRVGSLPHE